MANVLMTEGFDMYNGNAANTGVRALWTTNDPGGAGLGMSGGRFGGQALNIFGSVAGGNNWAYRNFDPAGATTSLSFGVALSTSSLTAGDRLWQIDNLSNNPCCSFGFTSAGVVYCASGSFGSTLCSSAAGALLISTWAYLEAELVLNASTGSVNLYLNGALIASATGVNTLASGGAGAFVRAWGRTQVSGASTQFDDVYVYGAATRLGECRVETLRPTGDNSAVWTPNSGANNYSRVNEATVDGNTSYVQTASTNVRDLYANGTLSSTPASIFAVNVVSFAEKTDATTRQLYNSVRSGSTDSDGSAFNLAASYGRLDRILQTDPNTSAAWSALGVNNLLYGPKAA
jgi:hypothetical protein